MIEWVDACMRMDREWTGTVGKLRPGVSDWFSSSSNRRSEPLVLRFYIFAYVTQTVHPRLVSDDNGGYNLWVEIHPSGQTTGSPYPRTDRASTRTVYFLSRDNISRHWRM